MPTVAEAFDLARQQHQAGNLREAEQIYRQILEADQGNAEARTNLGLILAQLGRNAEAIDTLQQAVRLKPGLAMPHYILGLLLRSSGQRDGALAEFRGAVRCQGDFAEALHEMGNLLVERNELAEAESSFRECLRLRPERHDIHHNLGFTLQCLGRVAEAALSYQQALRLNPNSAEAYFSLGTAFQSLGRLEEALASYHQAIALNPHLIDAHYNLGSVLQSLGRLDEAQARYRQVLALHPDHAGAHYNIGTALQSQGHLDEAAASYRQTLMLDPRSAEAQNNLGSVLQSQGQFGEAVNYYRQALVLHPDFAEAHNNLGLALVELGKMEEAATFFQRALKIKPEFASAHSNLAGCLRERGEALEAVASYQEALRLDPPNPAFLSQLLYLLQQLCIWDQLHELARQVIDSAAQTADSQSAGTVDPFLLVALPTPTTPLQQLQCARKWAAERVTAALPLHEPFSFDRPRDSRAKLKIGYLSADYYEHATAYLIAELIEKHDRERFTIFGYDIGPKEMSPMRRRLEKACDRLVDVKNASFLEAARRIYDDEVDILVDLKGYTAHARPQIMALRPAPIQVSYLGYPGTLGASFIDYIFVDDFVAPADQQPFFTEKLWHLPGCYQVNDSQREIAAHTPTRAECGLPETGFVFCCFSNNYKITPRMFDVWMRLLKATAGSVLWLLENNPIAAANLQKEARSRSVAPERLVLAPRLPLAEHLARHRQADLFLDTYPYNAHTTASDALWAGCPVLTFAGQTFASRVAGSLLRTIGLPELITTSLKEYQAMALRLAGDTGLLADLRARLEANRKTSPLFDGGQFARGIEKAYGEMWRQLGTR